MQKPSKTLIAFGAVLTGAALALGGVAVAASSNDPEGPTRPAAPATVAAASVAQTEYVPLAPCRIADSRLTQAGKYTRNATRVMQIAGTANFSGQGGATTGCGVPLTAQAAVLSFTTTNSTGQGRLTVFPSGAKPNTTALTYYKNVKISGEVTAKLAVDGTIRVSNVSFTSTDVVVDVVGYYAQPISAVVAPSATSPSGATLVSHSAQVTTVTKTDTGQYQVAVNTPIQNCSATATAEDSGTVAAAYTDLHSDYVQVYLKKASDGSYVDHTFSLQVTC